MLTITRGQLAALTALHQHGNAYDIDGGPSSSGRHGTRRETLDALIRAGLATDATQRRDIKPAANVWADGFGTWHVQIPARIANTAAVARAVIQGELDARGTAAYRTPVRVAFDISANMREGFVTFREVTP